MSSAADGIIEIDGFKVRRCRWCGKPFLPTKGRENTQVFCSPACRKSYYRHRDKNAVDRTDDLKNDNDRLRDTISRQEEMIEYESTERRQAEHRASVLEGMMRTVADDLSELFSAGVLTIDRNNPAVELLNSHDHFLRVMEDWSSKERDTIDQQRTDIGRVKQRWREERGKAIAAHRPADWIRDLDREYQNRLNDLMAKYKQYAAYLALEDMEDDHRQETGTALPLDGTEAEPLRSKLQDFANNQNKERTTTHETVRH